MTYSAQPTTIRGTTATPPQETSASSPPSPFAPAVHGLPAHHAVPSLAKLCFATLDAAQELSKACRDGDIELVRVLLRNGAVPTFEMLKEAFTNHHDAIVALLKDKDVSIDTLTKDGGSLLHIACLHHKLEEVERLIKLGANVDHPDIDGVPPLIVAFEKRDTTPAMTREIMLKLLDTGADIEIRWGGDTPLIAAARANNLTAFSLLLDKGANKNVKSEDGDTLWDIVLAPEIHPSIFYRLMGYKGPEL
jgi:ankyrin repeat protein